MQGFSGATILPWVPETHPPAVERRPQACPLAWEESGDGFRSTQRTKDPFLMAEPSSHGGG